MNRPLVVDDAGYATSTFTSNMNDMTTAQKRETWRAHCRQVLEQFGVEIHNLPSGALRLIGWHGDITVVDLADITQVELFNMTRIRT
jgi:hypothetical protein